MVTANVETITPLQAKAMLEFNNHNRKLKNRAVSKFANFMKAGKWRLNGESIIFYEDGELADGQNRLSAVVLSGVSIQSVVVRGVVKDDGKDIDSGTARTAGDVLYMNDIPNSYSVASGIRYYMCLGNSFSIKSRNDSIAGYHCTGARDVVEYEYSNSGINDEYKKDAVMWQNIYQFADKLYRKLKMFNKSEIMGVYAYLMLIKRVSPTVIEDFFTQLIINSNDYQFLNQLRQKLINNKISNNANFDAVTSRMLKRKAWNMFFLGKKGKQISYDRKKEGIIEFLPKE